MEFHEVKQRLFADGLLEDIKAVHEELTGLDAGQEPFARWETLRSAFETNGMTHQWSPWAAYLVAYLDTLPADDRPRVAEHHEALLDAVSAQVLAAYEAELPPPVAEYVAEAVDAQPVATQPPFTAEALWSGLAAEMANKAGLGDIPKLSGSARAVAKRLVEVAWNAALGQHTANDAVDLWIHRCVDVALRNFAVDPEMLRGDRRAFFALREAMNTTAEGLVAASARHVADAARKKSRKAEAAPSAGDDPLDGESLRILFGEVDMQTILNDQRLTEVLTGLVNDGSFELEFEEIDELPSQTQD